MYKLLYMFIIRIIINKNIDNLITCLQDTYHSESNVMKSVANKTVLFIIENYSVSIMKVLLAPYITVRYNNIYVIIVI